MRGEIVHAHAYACLFKGSRVYLYMKTCVDLCACVYLPCTAQPYMTGYLLSQLLLAVLLAWLSL